MDGTGYTCRDGLWEILKDPDALLDYTFDWSAWLPLGDTIVTSSVTISNSASMAKESETITGGNKVVVELSGGALRDLAAVRCRITTAAGRIDDRTIYVRVQDR